MLDEHLSVTGITTLCKLHDITDPDFWKDFNRDSKDPEIQIAAVRKSAELRKIMEQKQEENSLFYGSFSEQVLEVLRQFEQGQIKAAETLKRYAQIVRNMQVAESAHQQSNLNQKAYGILKILEAFIPENQGQESSTQSNSDSTDNGLNPLEKAAQAIDELYSSDETAPPGWHLKEQLRKGLRQQIRAKVFKLGLKDWKEIPNKVDEYALKHYIKQ
jgi:type I restriction enzyme R subunit